jgi:hypothetical protein
MGGGSDDSYAKEEAARQKRIKEGTYKIENVFRGFDEPFYQQRARAYTEYGLPQVEDQYSKAAEKLKYALARQYGTTQTSEAAKRQAELTNQYMQAKADVATKAQQYANQARTGVEQERQNLMSQLQTSADPAAAARMALTSSELLQKPTAMDPIGTLFSNVTEGLASANYPYGLFDNPQTSRYSVPGVATSPVRNIG